MNKLKNNYTHIQKRKWDAHNRIYIEYLYPIKSVGILRVLVCACVCILLVVLIRSVHWDEGMILDRNDIYIPVGELLCLAALGVERLH